MAKSGKNWAGYSTNLPGRKYLEPGSCPHVLEIPPKHAVASVLGFQGKSAIAIARLGGRERNYNGVHFWARGHAVSTVGFDEEIIRKYIREQSETGEDGKF